MRTKQAEVARYTWLTPRQFGERIGVSEGHVRDEIIAAGWFQWSDGSPECQDVRKPGGRRPEYRIKPSAVQRWFRERAVVGVK